MIQISRCCRMKSKEEKAVDYATFALLSAWDTSISVPWSNQQALLGDMTPLARGPTNQVRFSFSELPECNVLNVQLDQHEHLD